MSPIRYLHNTERQHGAGTVVFVLDGYGTVLMCTSAVEELTGYSPGDIRGRGMDALVTDAVVWHELAGGASDGPREGSAALRHRTGEPVEVYLRLIPLEAGGDQRFLVSATSAELALYLDQDQALVRALFSQSRVGLAIHDTELRTIRINNGPVSDLAVDFGGRPLNAEFRDLLVPEDAAVFERNLRHVAETGDPMVDQVHLARRRGAPDVERVLSVSAFRLHDVYERFMGVATVYTDITDQHVAQRRMTLLHAASDRLGQSLNVKDNCEQLAQVLVPDFADLAAVDLTRTVLKGDEPGDYVTGAPVRRTAVATASGRWPSEIHQLGETLQAGTMESEYLRRGKVIFVPELTGLRQRLAGEPDRERLLLPHAATSLMVVPLGARGRILGALGLWRLGGRVPFDKQDAYLAEEIGSRAALSVDNARRYTREHRTVETLQRSLLPQPGIELSAAETAGLYVPAGTAAGIGGTWYDVIPLSSARVALVVGEVVGHGLRATATMGRLRTAVQTLADLDLSPEELLTHLDDLVIRLAGAEPQVTVEGREAEEEGDGDGGGVVGASCLYCVYDPVTGCCVMASAGHPPPVLSGTEEPARFVDLKPGPALGVGGMPFEPVELPLTPGSVLTLYTDALVAHAEGDTQDRMSALRESVDDATTAGSSPISIGRAVLEQVLSEPLSDDVTLLVARLRSLPPDATVAWQFGADPAEVSRARDVVTGQLDDWGLEELAFTTELIVSELVTNAIRYAGAPIGLRLILDTTLICEVSDPSQTQPHLRRARPTDEGGRGLFLIAQLAHRWGSRYTTAGKTIWAEQPLPPG